MNDAHRGYTSKIVFSSILEFFSYALVATVPYLAIYIDLFYLQNIVGEESFVECSQTLFLLCIFALFAYNAVKFPSFRAGFVLLAGFILCMCIRESDNLFDHVRHGSWVYFALAVALGCILYALKNLHAAFNGLHFLSKAENTAPFWSVWLL